MPSWEIKQGDVLEQLRLLPDNSIQCVVTSPPYWGLRNYGVDGQIGLEATPEEYVQRLVVVFREVWRALKADGTLWLNLGDSYAGGGNYRGCNEETLTDKQRSNRGAHGELAIGRTGVLPPTVAIVKNGWCKAKDLVGIPWLVALALRSDGWYLRQDIIWSKRNPMPESVRDRCTKSHEYIFLLTKNERYYYDSVAMKEPAINAGKRVSLGSKSFSKGQAAGMGVTPSGNGLEDFYDVPALRNRRSVWELSSQPYKGAHFATFPEKLVEPCIKAGTKKGDLVLDPFAGSGTTGAVAIRLGRNFIGIDINSEYCELAKQRIGGVEVQPCHV